MKMFTKSRKKLSMLLAFVLVLSLSTTTVFAQWPSFQKDSNNNGIIVSKPGISNNTVVDGIKLPGQSDVNLYPSGVNITPIMQTTEYLDGVNNDTKTIGYIVYDGNSADGDRGGARIAAIDAETKAVLWDEQINDTVTRSQLSTPVIVSEDEMYLSASKNIILFDFSDYTGFDKSGNTAIDANGLATFTGNGSVSTSITLDEDVHTLYIPTNIGVGTRGASADYMIKLSDGTNNYILANGTVYYSSYGGGTYDTYNGAKIPAGNYTLSIEVSNISAGSVTANTLEVISYSSGLYKVSGINTPAPKVVLAKDKNGVDLVAEGQLNTPLYNKGDYIYGGMYGGTRSYYQYNYKTGEIKTFAADDNFYWAGAYSDGNSVFFGSDSGKIYKQSVNNFEIAGDNKVLGDGNIRSSIVGYEGDLYFTSKGSGDKGKLWKLNPVNLENVNEPIDLEKNSTSTPTISDSGTIYVGYYGYDPATFASDGGVQAIDLDSFTVLGKVYEGDPIQSSVVVYRDGEEELDYIYFATNAGSGKGYCYEFDVDSKLSNEIWSLGGTSGNNYAPQGFAADNGYLMYGDNGGFIYIIK